MAELKIRPIGRSEAFEWIRQVHRHHSPPAGYKFAVGLDVDGRLCGVAVAGRPVARNLDDGYTLEVTRVATDGTKNACSKLYGACVRASVALGYNRLVTYTLPSEGGASLRAAGWQLEGQTGGGSWARQGRLPLVSALNVAAGNETVKSRWTWRVDGISR